jgi:hypothetical protein
VPHHARRYPARDFALVEVALRPERALDHRAKRVEQRALDRVALEDPERSRDRFDRRDAGVVRFDS